MRLYAFLPPPLLVGASIRTVLRPWPWGDKQSLGVAMKVAAVERNVHRLDGPGVQV